MSVETYHAIRLLQEARKDAYNEHLRWVIMMAINYLMGVK